MFSRKSKTEWMYKWDSLRYLATPNTPPHTHTHTHTHINYFIIYQMETIYRILFVRELE